MQAEQIRTQRAEQLARLRRLADLETRRTGVGTLRLHLPVDLRGATHEGRDLVLLAVGEEVRTGACFAVRYGGETVYRRGARARDQRDLAALFAERARTPTAFLPFRGVPAELLGWAADEDGRGGIPVDADPVYNERDPFRSLQAERDDLLRELSLARWRWGQALAAELTGSTVSAEAAAAALTALLADPWLQADCAAPHFDLAARDPFWTFEAGGCGLLTLTLQREIGGVLVAVRADQDPKTPIEHTVLGLGGMYLDARGLQDEQLLRQHWGRILDCDPAALGVAPLSRDELDRHFAVPLEQIAGFAALLRLTLPRALNALGDRLAVPDQTS